MADITHGQGLAVALLERFEKVRLSRALDVQAKVDRGKRLDETEIAHLRDVLVDSEEFERLGDELPDLQDIDPRGQACHGSLPVHHEVGAGESKGPEESPDRIAISRERQSRSPFSQHDRP